MENLPQAGGKHGDKRIFKSKLQIEPKNRI